MSTLSYAPVQLSSKDKKLVRQLTACVGSQASATTFYWDIDDINGFDMDEALNSNARAQKLRLVLEVAGRQFDTPYTHIVDWDDTALHTSSRV